MLVKTLKRVQLVLNENITVEIDDKQAENLLALGVVEKLSQKAKGETKPKKDK